MGGACNQRFAAQAAVRLERSYPPPHHLPHLTTSLTSAPQVRQLGHPALLAAQYSGNTSAVASAAVNELEEALVGGWLWLGLLIISTLDASLEVIANQSHLGGSFLHRVSWAMSALFRPFCCAQLPAYANHLPLHTAHPSFSLFHTA